MRDTPNPDYRPPRHGRTALVLAATVAGMIGLTYASVPLYYLFCAVTGYGGTTQRAAEGDAPTVVSDRVFTVQFDANTSGDLPWTFKPEQASVTVRAGEQKVVFYKAINHADRPVTGRALFNVTPDKTGPYFTKIACFCFEQQTLQAGQEVDMPVLFYIDPEVVEDRNVDEVKTITLSYTFFRDQDDEAKAAAAPAPATPTN
ncbi:cytochrome c oxidase assembly protein [Zavarzinia aquatilis]|uniref:Cytochrome c oxidase assembly protein CtaG n=1 Tax=Zavarzinia aquatilis TaxID=2211142 RepID=A0A317E531_9PROT|nr:cytochrome c oxidase assembly protein [Zavarzinia aquatilis]PWR21474.1 cytochrome c oxidase assembly protein [Zavarzinia aquatilis]